MSRKRKPPQGGGDLPATEVAASEQKATESDATEHTEVSKSSEDKSPEPASKATAPEADPDLPPESGATDELGDDEFPTGVDVARALTTRLWAFCVAQDVIVLVVAVALVVLGSTLYRGEMRPPTAVFERDGLSFVRSSTWLPAEPLPDPGRALTQSLRGPAPSRDEASSAQRYHVEMASALNAFVHLEVHIDSAPLSDGLRPALALERRLRYGELYWSGRDAVVSIAGTDWLRTPFRYAYKLGEDDVPRVTRAVEYATATASRMYVITFHGNERELVALEQEIAPSLRLDTAARSVTHADGASPRADQPFRELAESIVLLVAIDVVDGALRPVSIGSGVVVTKDGSVLTNYHVVHDVGDRLHDYIAVARFAGFDRTPQYACMAIPQRGKLAPDKDLALLKCDTSLEGATMRPENWIAAPIGSAKLVVPSQRLWALAFPSHRGGLPHLAAGELEGWSSEDGGTGKAFMKTNIAISSGMSGGPVIDDDGRLVGIASAYRRRTSPDGSMALVPHVGLVRPIESASDLIALAQVGWLPMDGRNEVEPFEPPQIDPARVTTSTGEVVFVSSRVVDAANDRPIEGAIVVVFKPGIERGQIDLNQLDRQSLAWGRTKESGEFSLRQPVPTGAIYTVAVLAPGFQTLVREGALDLPADAPRFFDPWGQVRLERR